MEDAVFWEGFLVYTWAHGWEVGSAIYPSCCFGIGFGMDGKILYVGIGCAQIA